MESPPTMEPPQEARRRSLTDYLTDPGARRIEWLALGLLALFALFALVVVRGDLVAQTVPLLEDPEAQAEAAEAAAPEPLIPDRPYTLAALDLHPDRLYAPYLSGAFIESDSARAEGDPTLRDFRTQLDVYEKRAGVDDNFSIRVFDNRTWKTLEVYTLRDLRQRYQQSGRANWDQVDRARSAAHNQLTRKWVARGIPREAISLRWGRANQIKEARERELPFIEYEIRYARHLGLSLLAAEIGTVETFNQDWLVSSAGARGRYQMMPDILRLFGLETYELPAASGTVRVREELHPLLALQGSFLLVRGYANAVGHEIPGVSAYHTGPGNIFHLYGTYLRANAAQDFSEKTVIDGYMWGVTSGFERVRKQSSFGPASRGYVLSAYGALRAVENDEIDPSLTLRTEQVRLGPGQRIALTELLTLLEPHEGRLDWGPGNDDNNLYQRFRELNPHMALPRTSEEGSIRVPAEGRVTLARSAGNDAVRFFLPYGATELLARIRPGLLDEDALVRFDQDTFTDPEITGEKTAYDRAYDQLVEDIAHFGFTGTNQRRLNALYAKMQELAAESPTPYRLAQARIITIHWRTWRTNAFQELSGAVANVLGGGQRPTASAQGRG